MLQVPSKLFKNKSEIFKTGRKIISSSFSENKSDLSFVGSNEDHFQSRIVRSSIAKNAIIFGQKDQNIENLAFSDSD